MRVFVATRAEDIPADARPFLSVDGSVPGAVRTWDHHVTGEPVNLDAMPDTVERAGVNGVGTTLADTDALASVLAVFAGGKARLPAPVREVLYAASYRCDHLVRAPGVSDAADEAGRGLHRWVSARLRDAGAEVSARFEAACLEVQSCVTTGRPLPTAPPDPEVPRSLAQEGRLTPGVRVACFDLRGHPPIAPEVLHAQHDRPVAVLVKRHADGGPLYTIGVNPFHVERPADLRPLLAALAREEHRHGAPCLAPAPGPGTENWGGRATVFGSPWNYGSRLSPEEVVAVCERVLAGG